MYDKFLS